MAVSNKAGRIAPPRRVNRDLDLLWRNVWVGDGFRGADGNIWEVSDLRWHDGQLRVAARRRVFDPRGEPAHDDDGKELWHTYEDEVSPDARVRVVWVLADTDAERAAIYEFQQRFMVSPIWEA